MHTDGFVPRFWIYIKVSTQLEPSFAYCTAPTIFACPCTPRAWLRTHLNRLWLLAIVVMQHIYIYSIWDQYSSSVDRTFPLAGSRMPLLSHMAAAAARGPDAGQGRAGASCWHAAASRRGKARQGFRAARACTGPHRHIRRASVTHARDTH